MNYDIDTGDELLEHYAAIYSDIERVDLRTAREIVDNMPDMQGLLGRNDNHESALRVAGLSVTITATIDDEIIDGELVDDEPRSIEPAGSPASVAQRAGLAALRRGLLVLDDQRAEMVARQDADGLAHGAADLRDIISDLSALKRNVESDLAVLLLACHEAAGLSPRRNPKHFVEGLGEIDVPGGNERKDWESKKILRLLIQRTFYDHETGEAKPHATPEEAVEGFVEILESCLTFGPSTSWKVGTKDSSTGGYVNGLRGVGIDPSDYCTELAKPRLAVIPKRPGS